MLENRATVCAGNKEILCPRCDEPFVFGMKDNFHEFSIGLTTILECTAIAEHLGYLPQLIRCRRAIFHEIQCTRLYAGYPKFLPATGRRQS